MLGLLFMLLKFVPNILGFLKARNDNAKETQLADLQSQIEFYKYMNHIEVRVVQQITVLAFVAALFSSTWGTILTANARAMPAYGWAIILWEFFGMKALDLVPGLKNLFGGNGNGNGNGGGADPDPQPQNPHNGHEGHDAP
jgi:hypothetical protein